jgi:hypothetical protein
MTVRYYDVEPRCPQILRTDGSVGWWVGRDTGRESHVAWYADPKKYDRSPTEVFPAWATDIALPEQEKQYDTSDVNLIREALDGQRGADQQRLAEYGVKVVSTLIRKNNDYGGSAWQRPELADHLSPGDAILVRLSDKLARLKKLLKSNRAEVAESINDTLLDAAGYFILLVAKPEESNE